MIKYVNELFTWESLSIYLTVVRENASTGPQFWVLPSNFGCRKRMRIGPKSENSHGQVPVEAKGTIMAVAYPSTASASFWGEKEIINLLTRRIVWKCNLRDSRGKTSNGFHVGAAKR